MASKGKRWAIGCGLGCLVLIAVIIATVISFTLWVRGSGELLEPQKLLGSDTTGYLEWSLRMEDEGTQGFEGHLRCLVVEDDCQELHVGSLES